MNNLRNVGAALVLSCILASAAWGQAPAPKTEALADILMPNNAPAGFASKQIRELPGGENAALAMFHRLAAGGKDITPKGFPGFVRKRADGAVITYIRPFRGGPPPIILIQAPKFPISQLQFPPNPGQDGGGGM